MNYSNFEVDDFVLDESFQLWVKGSDPDVNQFWERWVTQNPQKRQTIENARAILLNFQFRESQVQSSIVESEWDKLSATLELEKETGKVRSIYVWQKIAATILLVFAAVLVFYFYRQSQYIIYSTGYGQTKSITLPDHSVVNLNGNSSIKIRKEWSEGNKRMVELDGEAFFSVTHQMNNQKFVVKTNDLEVIVIGTEFDVKSRRGKVNVVLNKGKVKLKKSGDNCLVMKPGDMVMYSSTNKKYTKREVNPKLYSSWLNNKLEFRSTSLKEIARLLEDNYGIQVIIKDKDIAERKLTGTYPADNIHILIKALTGIFDINITQNKDQLILENKR